MHAYFQENQMMKYIRIVFTFNFNNTHLYLIPKDALCMVTFYNIIVIFYQKLWLYLIGVTIMSNRNTISPLKFIILSLRIPGGGPWTGPFHPFLDWSPGHRKENASPGSNEVGANTFALIALNIAGKYIGKDGPQKTHSSSIQGVSIVMRHLL